jgi:hypothetical protein
MNYEPEESQPPTYPPGFEPPTDINVPWYAWVLWPLAIITPWSSPPRSSTAAWPAVLAPAPSLDADVDDSCNLGVKLLDYPPSPTTSKGRNAMTRALLWSLVLAWSVGCASAEPSRASLSAPSDDLDAAVTSAADAELASLLALYKWFHANPELSLKEEKTAAKFAQEVRDAGWTVTEQVGGTGVVAVLRNGEGPTILAGSTWTGCR